MATLEQLNLRKLWVKALRSGEYEQGRGLLKQQHAGKIEHCCLGVLCELVHVEWEEEMEEGFSFCVQKEIVDQGGDTVLPAFVKKMIGLRTVSGKYEELSELVVDNDSGMSFKDIADIIESNPKGLWED